MIIAFICFTSSVLKVTMELYRSMVQPIRINSRSWNISFRKVRVGRLVF